jgi:hypothetical protein
VRRRQGPHKTEVIVRRNPFRLCPHYLDLPNGDAFLSGVAWLRGAPGHRRVLQNLDPAVTFHRETVLDENPERSFDPLWGGPQEVGQLLDLDGVLTDVGEDAEQLVQGYRLGAEVGHPADVQTRLRAPRPYPPGRCEPHLLHLLVSITTNRRTLYAGSAK